MKMTNETNETELNVYWDLEKPFFSYSETTKTHKTRDKVKTICGVKIGRNPIFNYKETDKEMICNRCFKK